MLAGRKEEPPEHDFNQDPEVQLAPRPFGHNPS